jgi:arylsulfatase A
VRLNVRRDPNGPLDLYNLARDIGETTNVADKHPDIVAEMAAIMNTAHAESERYRLTRTG